MSDTTIHGLRFRRVLISPDHGLVVGDANGMRVCDALICRRCTSVLADGGEAERHVCVTRYWMAGFSFADYGTANELPDRPRERVGVANNANMGDLWPHRWSLIQRRRAAPLAERYELLSVLFAELAKMERGVEVRPRRRSSRPR